MVEAKVDTPPLASKEVIKETPGEKKPKSPEEHLDLAKKNQEKLDVDHPRFKEIYAKFKDGERVLAEKEKDIDALREHTQRMERKLAELAEKKADKSLPAEPDAELDPAGHKVWLKMRQAEKEKEDEQREYDREIKLAIRLTSAQFDDYDEAIKIAEKEMVKKPELRKEVWMDPVQAPIRAYRLGKKILEERSKVDDAEKERQARLKNSEVLKDGGEHEEEEEIKLSDEQKRVVRNLYPDLPYKDAEKRYVNSMKRLE